MTSVDDISKMLNDESQKLKILFDTVNLKTDVGVPEIIEMYYQVMNVSSMANMFKQQATESEELLKKIHQTEKLISERFDSIIHPKILEILSTSIQKLTQTLQSENSGEKSKEQTELDAKLFEELRQNMSTKEFVEQYETAISND